MEHQLVYKTNHILTYTKIEMSPLMPQINDISIYDIAHSLSFMCRANGHIKTFYSVGQHSINCCKEAIARDYPKKIQLSLLLHDSSEAYLADIVRPVKINLDKYLEIEENLQNTIYNRFGITSLSNFEHQMIHEIDNILLQNEFINLADTRIFVEDMPMKSQCNFSFTSFKDIEDEFLNLFNTLTK